ncbi:MAG: glycosyltransferase [Oscillatoriophycideae cyanobacterium NC_groundwater_1537_Pr4_S-0.65um_50_18]|nr:glycosyltransferase [Oscillatoriophycideae cyanobacterium NC_groundwater_1537_Pr4_S-0.65um_50_18]
MRKFYFLVPGTGGKFACGGLWAELKALALVQQIYPAELVTYRQREQGLFLDDLLQKPGLQDAIFVVSWGFDVPKLMAKLRSHHVVYHAHSAGYGFGVPAQIPIITVSRNTLGYWGQKAPHSLIYYLPNQISDEFRNLGVDRDIDVLVQARKSSEYLLQELVPALQARCRVEVVRSYVEDLPGLFNRARVYLYDSAEYWAQQGVSEGFGLQPMEAIACGCQVFSSVNGGLSDYVDPGFNMQKIACYSKEYDVQRILEALKKPPLVLPDSFFSEYRGEAIADRLRLILDEINGFFDHKQAHPSDIQPLSSVRLLQLNTQRLWGKLRKKLGK